MKKNNTPKVERIYLASYYKNKLADEFETTKQTVQLALDHYNNSELAKAIRRRAKELLKNEIEKIKD